MGLRFRKSINLGGGFKVNFSKSGIGYSWGVPGYRITKTSKGGIRRTVGIPGTGLSYVEETSRKRKPIKKHESSNYFRPGESKSPVPAPDSGGYSEDVLYNIESADISSFQSTEYSHIIDTISKTIKYNTLSTVLICIGLGGLVRPVLLLCLAIGLVVKFYIRKKGQVHFEYEMDTESMAAYNQKLKAWDTLKSSCKLWQIIQEAEVSNRKVNAGANRTINRKDIKITNELPYYLTSNLRTIVLKLAKETLIILPDKVLILKGKKIGATDAKNINLTTEKTKFIEDLVVQKDSNVIDTTWKYVNKGGGPDKRFKDNRQLPVCLYGVLHITSPDGLKIELQSSNDKCIDEFETLCNSNDIK